MAQSHFSASASLVGGVSGLAAIPAGPRGSSGIRALVVATGGPRAFPSERAASSRRRGCLRLCSRCAALHSRCCLGPVARGSRVSAASVLGFELLRVPRPWSALGRARRGTRLAGLRSAPPRAGAVPTLGHTRPRPSLGHWHAPMFFVVGSLQAREPAWLFGLAVFAWSSIHTAFYHHSRPSVAPNLLFHGCANLAINLVEVPAQSPAALAAAYALFGLAAWLLLGRTRPVHAAAA